MTEQNTIRRCQAGDVAAFAPIFRSHIRMAVRTAFLITRDWAAAEDAAQEAMTRAFLSIRSFRPDQPFAPWLYRIVVNEARRAAHKAARTVPSAALPDALTTDTLFPEGAALDEERRRELWTAIHELDADHRIAVILKYFRGFTEAEIAVILNLRPSTVKSRLYVARQRLMSALGEIKEGRRR